jgi:hypothetical protein
LPDGERPGGTGSLNLSAAKKAIRVRRGRLELRIGAEKPLARVEARRAIQATALKGMTPHALDSCRRTSCSLGRFNSPACAIAAAQLAKRVADSKSPVQRPWHSQYRPPGTSWITTLIQFRRRKRVSNWRVSILTPVLVASPWIVCMITHSSYPALRTFSIRLNTDGKREEY